MIGKFRWWHKSEVSTLLSNVRFQGQPGRHLLTLSSSQFDPTRTSAIQIGGGKQSAVAPRLPWQLARRPFRTAGQCPKLIVLGLADYDDAIPRKKGCPRPGTH